MKSEMEIMSEIPFTDQTEAEGNSSGVENISDCVNEVHTKVSQLEQKLIEVEEFYLTANEKQLNTSKGNSLKKEITSIRKHQSTKRMQELIRQFGTMLRQITQHKWAGPFLEPVDVIGLDLHDYYEVIKQPMDFNSIKNKMEAKDGTGYKHVREICSDVRLIFKNAMKYNEERDDVHVMAKTLLGKFEEKWLLLLPKVDEEEKRRKEEEAEAQMDVHLAQEAAYAKIAKELTSELDEVDMHLDELKETMLQKCRKLSTDEKRRLGDAITHLSSEDLHKALSIVAQDNPSFEACAEMVELVLDSQSDTTLWKLKIFVKDALLLQQKNCAMVEENNQINNKRKKEISDMPVKSCQRKSRKP